MRVNGENKNSTGRCWLSFSFHSPVLLNLPFSYYFDLLNPDNKYELDWMIWYILPWDIISLWAWGVAAYCDPGFVTAEHFMPLPEKMDKVDKATLERIAS